MTHVHVVQGKSINSVVGGPEKRKRRMIKKDIIKEAIDRLIKAYSPLEVYLFGSYAWGEPHEDSDLDFLIIVEDSEKKRYERAILGHHVLFGLMIPKDILVYTKAEFENAIKDKTSFSYKIKRDGKKLYAKA